MAERYRMKPVNKPSANPKLFKPVIIRKTNRKIARRHIPEHTFLKYFRLVRAWIRIVHGWSLMDFEILCYLHSFVIFSDDQIDEAKETMTFNPQKRKELLDRGLIIIYRKKSPGNKALYELSEQSRILMDKVYKRVLGMEPVENFVTEYQLKKKSSSRFSHRQYTRAAKRMRKDLENNKNIPF